MSRKTTKEFPINIRLETMFYTKFKPKAKFANNPYKGPYINAQVNNNGTAQVHMGVIY